MIEAERQANLMRLSFFILAVLGCVSLVDAQPSGEHTAARMQETDVVRSLAAGDLVALSPDASQIALLHTDYDHSVRGDEGKGTVEIRDVKSSTIVATYAMPRAVDMRGQWEPWRQGADRLQFCDKGKYLVVSAGTGKVYVLSGDTLQPRRVIDLNAVSASSSSSDKQTSSQGADSLQTACAVNGNVAAFHPGGGRYGAGSVFLFDLDSGSQIRTGFANISRVMSVAVSPEGQRVALFGTDGPGAKGKAISVILVFKNEDARPVRIETGAAAGAMLLFLNESVVAIAEKSASEEPPFSAWNATNGARLEESWWKTERAALKAVSSDGNVLLFDTGNTHWCPSCNKNDGKRVIDSSRIRLTEPHGQAIAESQGLEVVHHNCPKIYLNSCDSEDEAPKLGLSQNGKAVIAYWASGGKPVKLFTF